jgi:hypothetical protein
LYEVTYKNTSTRNAAIYGIIGTDAMMRIEGYEDWELEGEPPHLGIHLVVVLLGLDPSGHQVILHSVGQGKVVVPADLTKKVR